jgi:hypothetical protein
MPVYYRDLVPLLATRLTGTAAACGTTSTEITVPSKTTSAMIHAEGGAIYWKVNGTAAVGTTAPGYAAADQTGYLFPIDNFGTLHVVGSGTAAVAHIEFFQD